MQKIIIFRMRLLLATIVAGWVAICVVGDEPAKPATPPTKPVKYARPVLIPFDGDINPLSEQSFYRKLAAAEEYGADLIFVEIDSPGGWVECSLNLAEKLRKIQWARTVAYVPREAISGAAVMALGCDDIVMAPHALLGDAGEIFRDEQGAFRYVPEKARSYLASRLRVLAQSKGRAPALAEAMCDMNLKVFQVRHKETGTESFLSEQEIAASGNPGQWEKIKPVFGTREKHFLTVNGQEALELKLAQSLQSDLQQLKQHYQLSTPEMRILRHTSVDTAVTILNAPIMTGLLFIIGLIALYVEFSLPGTWVGGLIAGLCFALFFWSRFLGGTAGWLELILFLAGLSFLAMELFVIPGFGVAGISGILLIIASVVMASQSFLIPHNTRELNVTLMQFGIVLTSGVLFLISASVLTRYIGALPVARSLVLQLPDPIANPVRSDDPVQKPIPSPLEPRVVIGDRGIADSPLRPAGKIRVGEQYLDVISDGTFIDRGRVVRIVEVSGNRIVVRQE
jgi:membrane-bound serine protease (ClpP class)